MAGGVAYNLQELNVVFGGFTPNGLTNSRIPYDLIEAAEKRAAEMKESREKAAAVEAARASEERTWTDEVGTVWHYVLLDDKQVRIESCEPAVDNLSIPSSIEGLPTVALAADACAFLDDVREIFCPDSILSIGSCAFRSDRQLRKIILPALVADFQPGWLRNCLRVEYLELPGRAPKINAGVFDMPALKQLVIGPGLMEVAPGTFAKSRLESVLVDDENPVFSTDGSALYANDNSVLVALCVPCSDYTVQPGCTLVDRKAFYGFSQLQSVVLSDSVQKLEPFAFAGTGLKSFEAPESLIEIGEKGFFNCEKLTQVQLNEGLKILGNDCLTNTALEHLYIPATVESLGNPLAAHSHLVYAGDQATFEIDCESPYLQLDGKGGLYGKYDDGLRLVRLLDPTAKEYAVVDGTTAILPSAFSAIELIEHVILPRSLKEICPCAFKGCTNLTKVDISDGLLSIGDEAFLDSNLESIYIPSSVDHIGSDAFVTHGAHHGTEQPSLKEIVVDKENTRFYEQGGLLFEHKDNGADRLLISVGKQSDVILPPEVDELASYALNDVCVTDNLVLSDRIKTIGIRGLAIDGLIGHIVINLENPVQGHDFFEYYFPHTDRGQQQLMLTLGIPSAVNPELFFEHYDNSIVNASSFDALRAEGLSTYDQATRIIARLMDPVYMQPPIRALCDGILGGSISEICIEIAKHDDRKSIDALIELGYLNEKNINDVIESIGVVQDAAMTGYLLEQKRLRFSMNTLDFDL